jgi:hypothetical protein
MFSKALKLLPRDQILDPIDRVSEMLFGLFMALTFVGAVSVASSGRGEITTLFIAALGCNLAWGLVDGVMYLVSTIIARGHSLAIKQSVRATNDVEAGRKIIEQALPPELAGLISPTEIEAIRRRLQAAPELPGRPTLARDDLLGALATCLIAVASTFPVVLPFLFFTDVATALAVSRLVALAMLFGGGLVLGRYAGYGSWKAGFTMVGLGAVLVAIIIALGG